MQRQGGHPPPDAAGGGGGSNNKRKASSVVVQKNGAPDDDDDDDEELRLARAVADFHTGETKSRRRLASVFAESQLPGAARRPECNYGERWEVEEALATVPAHMGGAEAAAKLGMSHPAHNQNHIDVAHADAGGAADAAAGQNGDAGGAAVLALEAPPTAELDAAERGFHPTDAAADTAGAAGAPVEWVQTHDAESGDYYYFNPVTRETSWDPPDGAEIQLDEKALAAILAVTSGGGATSGGTSEGGGGASEGGGGASGGFEEGAAEASAAPAESSGGGRDGGGGGDGAGGAVWNGAHVLAAAAAAATATGAGIRGGDAPPRNPHHHPSSSQPSVSGRSSRAAAAVPSQAPPPTRHQQLSAQEQLWALEDARRRKTEAEAGGPAVGGVHLLGTAGEGTAGLWAAQAAAQASAQASAQAAQRGGRGDDDVADIAGKGHDTSTCHSFIRSQLAEAALD